MDAHFAELHEGEAMKRRFFTGIACLALAVLACSCGPEVRRDGAVAQEGSAGTLAVLGAFNQEVGLLERALAEPVSREIEGITFMSGRIANRPVVVAWTGVGKVNTAMVTTLLIEHYKPTRVLFTGIAGGVDPKLEPGDIVIAKQTAHHDMGIYWVDGIEPGGVRNRLTGDTNPVFFPADANLLAVAAQVARDVQFDPVVRRDGQRPPRVVVGTVVTGDTFVASKEKCEELAEKLGADAVEMEGAAVAQICYQRGIPCLVIRSIADKADEDAIVDKQRFYTLAARNSARLVARIVESLEP
jgi:adenosylhomocysteine nucleosidase